MFLNVDDAVLLITKPVHRVKPRRRKWCAGQLLLTTIWTNRMLIMWLQLIPYTHESRLILYSRYDADCLIQSWSGLTCDFLMTSMQATHGPITSNGFCLVNYYRPNCCVTELAKGFETWCSLALSSSLSVQYKHVILSSEMVMQIRVALHSIVFLCWLSDMSIILRMLRL